MSTALTRRFNALQTAELDYIVLDASGSMSTKMNSMLAGLDTYIDTMKHANLNAHLMMCTFEDGPIMLQRDEPLADWIPFSSWRPHINWGGTAFYDAINSVGRELRDLDPRKASIIFVTDGEEVDSKYTNADQAKAIITWMKSMGWQVTFFGCDFDNTAQAQALGLDPRQFIGVDKRLLKGAAKALGDKRVRYGQTGQDMHFSDDEKNKFGGYLSGPSKA